MAKPFALLRSSFPFEMTMGMRRVTSNPVDIGFGKEGRVHILTRGGLGTEVRVINWEDENLGTRGEGKFTWPASLLVDDDDDLREALSEQLIMTEDFDVFEAANGTEAMTKAKEALYDLIILDVGLPDTDGRELCRLMRKQGVKSPILMLTGHDTDADTILGLDAGANDYVTKPFKFPVLLARIRAQLRQHEQSEDAVFQLGPYTFKPAMKVLTTEDDRKVRLTEKETNILKFLYRSNDGVVPRDVLLHEVWGYNAGVTTHTLETHIYRLRQKIEPDPSNARLLVTESGGYRLMA